MIAQKFDSDCAVACLAMFLGVTYESVAKHCHGFEMVTFGLGSERVDDIAGLFKTEIIYLDISRLDRSKPAVLTVPSLNTHGTKHAVYWDGSALHDPNTGRSGKHAYDADRAWSKGLYGYQKDED